MLNPWPGVTVAVRQRNDATSQEIAMANSFDPSWLYLHRQIFEKLGW
jgi:hypothetical protein